jgi:hypothetical protein
MVFVTLIKRRPASQKEKYKSREQLKDNHQNGQANRHDPAK